MNFFLIRRFKQLLFLTVLISGCSLSNKSEEKPLTLPSYVLNNDNHVQPNVVSLMNTLGCNDVPTRVDLFVEQYFTRFARKRFVERWDVKNEYDEQTTKKCLRLFEQLNFLGEIKPSHNEYDYLVLLGSTLQTLRHRLGYFKKLYEAGIRVKRIVMLTGERPLANFESLEVLSNKTQKILPIKESWQLLPPFPKTEAEMMQAVWAQADLPKDLTPIPLDVIVAPIKVNEDKTLERPNTGDIVALWLQKKPEAGRCLFISSQPYVGYQSGVIKRLIPKNFEIEIVGDKADRDKNSIDVLLDSLLRWLLFESYLCGLLTEEKLELYLKQ